MASDDARAKLRAHFASAGPSDNKKWSQLWDTGDFLPWDRGTPNPALEDLLVEHQELLGYAELHAKRKKALVPGCGRGYDVLLLASFGYDAYGLDVSENAIKQCQDFAREQGDNYPLRVSPQVGKGQALFVTADFFADAWSQEILGLDQPDVTAGFDLIYDYTFLCAMRPEMRPNWAQRCSQILSRRPKGSLVCLEFPTYKDPATGGPPFGLKSEIYEGHLSHPGRKIPYDENGIIQHEQIQGVSEGGLKRIAHWQPSRTHEIGKGTDWVSIWQHTS